MTDTGRATVGLMLAGAALVLALTAWPPNPVGNEIAVPLVVGGAAASMLGFSARRHGRLDVPTASALAGGGGLVLLIGGTWMTAGGTGRVSAWIPPAIAALGAGSLGLAAIEVGVLDDDHQFERAQALLFAIALGFGGLFLAGLLAVFPRFLTAGVGLELVPESAFALEQVGVGVGFVLATLAFVLGTGRGLGYLDFRMLDRRELGYTIGGTVAIVAAAIALGIIYAGLGIEIGEHTIARRARTEGARLVLVAIPLAWLATALGEELLFRNGIQKYLTERFTARAAILASCLIFTVAHIPAFVGVSVAAMLAPLFLVFALSLILAVIYERTRNVLVTILIHGTYNAFVYFTIFLQLAG